VTLSPRRERFAFAATLAFVVAGFFSESLFGGKILSPADVLFATKGFEEVRGPNYEPANRLLMDPVLQFQPWIEFNRAMIRSGRLPLWNSRSGCGAPHLANGQSAVFDPFQVIAYLGPVPDAYGWMAAARLWFAGLGMFLLARAWGLGVWGRWFAGLAFPFCGFVVVWLLYPVTNVAVWMPWVFLTTERVWERPTFRRVGWLGLAVGGTLLGGHVQTSAHLLLAVGLYSLWRGWRSEWKLTGLVAWSAGLILGLGIAAVEVLPLGAYLAKSPVWGDRERERKSPWELARPRVLDSACIALPYLYGSQRRGQPNLAKALGVYNLNESAGGFAGLATLIWLAPLAWSARRLQPRVNFLVFLVIFGFFGAYRLPPVDNLLRALPVLGVTDNRRLGLWVAFGLVLLGGIGLDGLSQVRLSRFWRWWGLVWVVVSVALLIAALGVTRFAPQIRSKALAHYLKASESTPGADPEVYRQRAERQARETLDFVPRYLALCGLQGLTLAGLLWAVRRGRIGDDVGRVALLGLTLIDLFAFGFGLNPAIERADDRPEPALIAALRSKLGPGDRAIGLGTELPPNTLMRYGLSDARNYDSIELQRNLDWFAPLYDPKVAEQTSRREITWERVIANRDRLSLASVRAVVGPTEPPASKLLRVEKVGQVWVALLDPAPMVKCVSGDARSTEWSGRNGRKDARVKSTSETTLIYRETFDPGWRASIDGAWVPVVPYLGTFLSVKVPAGAHRITFVYDPIEVKIGLISSIIAGLLTVFALTGSAIFRFTRIVLQRLGRSQALGLESESCPSPDDPTGENHRRTTR
jgi:hypothetical protein